MQTKHNPLEGCQLKLASDGSGEFSGYASVFNSNDKVNDTILRGAFKSSIASGVTPKGFINHDHKAIPAIDWLEIYEDDYGLFVKGRIDLNHKDGPSLYSAMKRGAMGAMSIGFTIGADDYETKSEGGRNIKNANLMEISVVTFPCEEKAQISEVKTLVDAVHDLKSFEAILRDEGGFSRAAAKALASRTKQFSQRDADAEVLKTIAEQEALIQRLQRRIATQNGQLLAIKIGGLK